jgi:hypothetical protein
VIPAWNSHIDFARARASVIAEAMQMAGIEGTRITL